MSGMDLFGHSIGVNYNDSATFGTKLSVFVSIATIGLIIANVCLLSLAFQNGDKQEEYTSFIQVDRFDTDPYNLGESRVQLAIFAEEQDQLDLNLSQFGIYQLQSCDDDEADCDNEARREKIGLAEECPDDRRIQINDFQKKIYGEPGSQKYKDEAILCVDMSKLNIKGEPDTRTEESVTIELELRPEIAQYESDSQYCQDVYADLVHVCDV